ncbi:conserved oligomeric Golgi complex subunit 5-like [Xenia sp. Carnegie-2017]|uniref:conserved oligomeric Golgi complex subunit 5-like n=1 Tax=Xenia sp. Carnegie-2017 TaxID=2897299 RepID=UPI001F03ED9A|nr:conserved oligomeric Golgi complex subunit 5-like [Xenia sp. Carnegie-2017]
MAGETMNLEGSDVLKILREDDTFEMFLEKDFDAKGYANNVIESKAIGDCLEKLADGIRLLDKELHSQVVSRHEDLLQQATGIETLEGVLQMMTSRITSLQLSLERIHQQISEPYEKIRARTLQLRRLQTTCDLLRRVIRISYLTRRLESQLKGGIKETTKAAQSLNELGYLMEGVDLDGIEVLHKDIEFTRKARTEVTSQAENMLTQGMHNLNQTQVATALQVFHNLGVLHETIETLVELERGEFRTHIKNTLDINNLMYSQNGNSGPGRAAVPAPGNTAMWRATLWTGMEKLMDKIYSYCGKIHHLLKVLSKKRDPVTHVCFMEEFLKENKKSKVLSFWKLFTETLREELTSAANKSPFLKQAFEGEYPKLLRLYNELWARLRQFHLTNSANNLYTGGVAEVVYGVFHIYQESDISPEDLLRNSLSGFESAYLSRSLSRLFDPINLVFPAGAQAPPSKEDVAGIVKTIASEMNVANVDVGLSVSVSRNVEKTLQLYTAKSEQLLVTSPDAYEIEIEISESQMKNAAIVNMLYELHQSTIEILGKLNYPKLGVEAIHNALKQILSLIDNAVEHLFMSMQRRMEEIIYNIYVEDFSSAQLSVNLSDIPEAPCSSYINELQDFIVHLKRKILSLYNCGELFLDRLNKMAARILHVFVRHVSLLRYLGEGGKLRLAADMAQIEFAVGPLCRRVSDLGRSYKTLRSFRPLLFQTAVDISNNPALGESLPFSLVLHHLLAQGPSDLLSPYEVKGWSLRYYNQWLDEHESENERLTLISVALETYVQSVRSRGEKEFASVYPILLKVLQKAST